MCIDRLENKLSFQSVILSRKFDFCILIIAKSVITFAKSYPTKRFSFAVW